MHWIYIKKCNIKSTYSERCHPLKIRHWNRFSVANKVVIEFVVSNKNLFYWNGVVKRCRIIGLLFFQMSFIPLGMEFITLLDSFNEAPIVLVLV